ncbi:MAG: aminodeoxychorismate synthase component I [Deltaproteobacteria bacterium]|nr:aminodeoxychorismate synthase component I [Deltaproteobacteria bacterium]
MLIEELNDILPFAAYQALSPLGRPFILSGSIECQKRYSYVGASPYSTITTQDKKTVVTGAQPRVEYKDPFEAASRIISESARLDAPFPFCGGLVGYFGYDLNELIEPSLLHDDVPTKEPGTIPDCGLGLYDTVFVFDHAEAKGYVVSPHDNAGKVKLFKELLIAKSNVVDRFHELYSPSKDASFTSNFTKEAYIEAIQKAQGYIAAGDIYQINLSQRLTMKITGDPFHLYATLVKGHPAPFSSFMDFSGFQVISNSPERLLKIEGRAIETSPIKGTRRRGDTVDEDNALIEELKESVKERAEHVMIVDLERSDLGQVAEPGSVKVIEFGRISTFPHLHHMVSTIRGTLNPTIDAPKALRRVFPGGSITGAPKIRAMRIIAELETGRRGLYTGALGWIGFNGDMDMAMAIRTAVVKDKLLHLFVGGGIVADSKAEDEYEETLLKAADFIEALGIKR